MDPAATVMVSALQLYAAFVGSVTTTSTSHAVSRVAVTVADVTREESPTLDSQMVVGLADSVTTALWSPAAWLPYLRVGYWLTVPKSQGSSVPLVRLLFPSASSTSMFQLA